MDFSNINYWLKTTLYSVNWQKILKPKYLSDEVPEYIEDELYYKLLNVEKYHYYYVSQFYKLCFELGKPKWIIKCIDLVKFNILATQERRYKTLLDHAIKHNNKQLFDKLVDSSKYDVTKNNMSGILRAFQSDNEYFISKLSDIPKIISKFNEKIYHRTFSGFCDTSHIFGSQYVLSKFIKNSQPALVKKYMKYIEKIVDNFGHFILCNLVSWKQYDLVNYLISDSSVVNVVKLCFKNIHLNYLQGRHFCGVHEIIYQCKLDKILRRKFLQIADLICPLPTYKSKNEELYEKHKKIRMKLLSQ